MLADSTKAFIAELNASGRALCAVCKFKDSCQEQCIESRCASAEQLFDYIVIQDKDALINQLLQIVIQEE